MGILITQAMARGFADLDLLKEAEIVRWEETGGYPAGWGLALHLFKGEHRHLQTARGELKTFNSLDTAYQEIERIAGGKTVRITIHPDWFNDHERPAAGGRP